MQTKFQQLKKQFLQNVTKKQIAIFGGVLGLTVAAYYIFNKFFVKRSSQTKKPTIQQEEKTFQQTYRDVIKSVQQILNIHKVLNGQVIKSILKNQYKLAEQEYKTYILKVRNQRRKIMKNKQEYGKIILSIDNHIQQLRDTHLNAIIAHFNIDKTLWIQTVDIWSTQTQQNKQEFQNLLVQLDNQQLDSLRDPNKKPMSIKKLQEIFKFKIHTLKNLNQSGLDLDSSTNQQDSTDLNAKYSLIDKYITDIVFNKFGVQQEDINYSENQLTNQQEKDRYATIYDQYTELLRIQIFGDQSIQDGIDSNVMGAVDESRENGDIADQANQVEDQEQSQYY